MSLAAPLIVAACIALQFPGTSRARALEYPPVVGYPAAPQRLQSNLAFQDGAVSEDEDDGFVVYDEPLEDRSFRTLLHGCHGRSVRCRNNLPLCPRCRFPANRGNLGHCKRTGRLLNCRRATGSEGNEGNEGALVSRFVGVDGFGSIGAGNCPSIHAATWPGHFDLPPVEYAGGDYGEEDVNDEEILDAFGYDEGILSGIPPEFAVVSTPDEFQEALRAGVNHIVLAQHLDMVDSTPEPDLKRVEALDGAIGRVLNTTLSIMGKCDGAAPASFGLTEPLPPGACAVRVKEDFLDAPLGTTCLLLDSLYMVVAPRSPESRSSVLVLHVDGLMWITSCVFQGSGTNGRAIDTNTLNGGTPALYIKDSTFTGFTRDLAPGIRVLSSSRLWLDNCIFRDIELIQTNRNVVVQATAVAAYDNVVLVLVNTTIEDNVVFGGPAGDQAVAISPDRTEVFASPRMMVWQWPEGPAVMSDAQTEVAEAVITNVARPELASIQSIQREIVRRGLLRIGED